MNRQLLKHCRDQDLRSRTATGRQAPGPGKANSWAARLKIKTCLLSLIALTITALTVAAPAGATATHSLVGEFSAGVPAGCGGGSEPPCLSGPLNEVMSVDVVGGRVWVADKPEGGGGGARIDAFGVGSPWAWVGPQIDEEAGVTGIGKRIAVGHLGSEEQVYTLADRAGEEVLAVYGTGSGKLLGSWTGAHTLTKSFTHETGTINPVAVLRDVAVDRSGNPLSAEDVYVATGAGMRPAFKVVDVFSGEPSGTIGEEPAVVATIAGTCATMGSSCPGEEVSFNEPEGVAVSPANGDVYVTDSSPSGEVVDVFRPAGTALAREYVFEGVITGPPSGEFRKVAGIAGDSGVGVGHGEVYVGDTEPALNPGGVVYQFGEEGRFLGRLTGTSASSVFDLVAGVGVDAGSHDLFVGEDIPEGPVGARARVDVFGPDIVTPDVETTPASAVKVSSSGAIEATFNGTVDPLGEGEADCQFVWGVTEAFGSPLAKCEPEGHTNAEAVQATVKGLAPDTSYVYRLQASNHNGLNPGEAGQDQRFTTPGPGVHSESVTSVSSTAATLDAGIDPNNAATRFYFQYSTIPTGGCEAEPAACSTAPGLPGELLPAGGGTDADVGIHVQNLLPGRTYHFRVVAVSDLEVGPNTVVPVAFRGADQTFTTQSAGSAFVLPDARQWELVSPPDKHGAVIYQPGQPASQLSSVAGDALTFAVTQPTESGVQGYSEAVQVLSHRATDGGWSSQDIAVPHASAVGVGVGEGFEYRAFSEDLSAGLIEPQGPFTSLAPNVFPQDTERTAYLRDDSTCTNEPGACYEPLLTGTEGYADVPPGTKFGGPGFLHTGAATFVGASPDLRHVILRSDVQLTVTPVPANVSELYEWSADKSAQERLELVSRTDENNAPASGVRGAVLGLESFSGEAIGRGAVSVDGSRVFWTDLGNTISGPLFLRDLSKGVSLRLDVAQGGSGAGPEGAVFQGASADGTRAFFLDQQRLTGDSGAQPGKADLYVCDIREEAGTLKCELHDLAPASGGESALVRGAASAVSPDGSWAYFVANGVLAGTEGEGARPGDCQLPRSPAGARCNLYVVHNDGSGWSPARLVAVLSGDDFPDWSGDNTTNFANLTARISPNGSLAFMSDRSLTGYDNRDAFSEKPDEEVFLYKPSTEGAGALACVSCDPTGARPVGVEYVDVREGLVGGNGNIWSDGQLLAASVPGYDQYELGKGLYQPRYLSNEDRVFFDSAGALVPQDVNHNQDVYEYEPAGVGDCTTGSSTYSSASRGCTSLISSGKAAGESAFLDASETGGDVFFLTGEKLVGSDFDNAVDVYDAHVCSSGAPCTSEAAVPPACTTADACRTAPEPQPAIFGAPSSATFTGAGNLPGSAPAVAVKPRALTRAQKLARALTACRKDKSKRRRAACERKAHEQFGAAKARSGKSKQSGKG